MKIESKRVEQSAVHGVVMVRIATSGGAPDSHSLDVIKRARELVTKAGDEESLASFEWAMKKVHSNAR